MSERPKSLKEAVGASGLKNGSRISFHHHLRLGDRVVEQVLMLLGSMGFKNLTLCVSSLMGSSCEAVLEAIKSGVVCAIETTGLKEPVASAMLEGLIPNPVIFRSHGGRAKAIASGRIKIDVAFIAVSAVDRAGNANGTDGPNRFGSLGYALVDADYAAHVILVSDYISEAPLGMISIPAEKADQIVMVDSIGDRAGIFGGSIRISSSPVEHLIARRALSVLDASGVIKHGFAFQAGSGGVSLLVSRMVSDLMRTRGITGEFAAGGATGTLSELLKEGLFRRLYDVQSFDDEAALSLKSNPNHIEMSASLYADPDNPDCIAHKLDVMILSATEVDYDFNINSITGSNGRILGALGGAPDTAAGAGLTVVVLPSFRNRIPTVRNRVHTICTPGKTVDVIVTERGICINPERPDIVEAADRAGIQVVSPENLSRLVCKITGVPDYPVKGKKLAGIVEYRDGSILDRIFI